jgi:raffinose/stachyose/melibiose transport system permease protein
MTNKKQDLSGERSLRNKKQKASGLERTLGNIAVVSMNIFLVAFAITALFPLVWMIYNSFKTSPEFAQNIFVLPKGLYLQNYADIFKSSKLFISLFNSLFNSVLATIGIVLLSFVIAYFLARYRFPGRNWLYAFFLFGLLVPIHGLLVPIFIQFKALGMLDTRLTLLPPYIAFGLSGTIFLIESYIRALPTEVEEAAFMDGATLVDLLTKVIFPMCRPIIATTAILSFLSTWNEFAFALVLLNDDVYKTMPIWLNTFRGERTVNYTGLMAALTVASLPVMIVYLIFREKIIQGFVAGAVRG